MNNGEFYSSKEYNYIGENKPFPAEIYKKPSEENSLGGELGDTGREITTLQKTDRQKKNSRRARLNNPIDKLFNSVKSITTGATVAVSAIAITATVVTGNILPGLDLFGKDTPSTEPPVIPPVVDVQPSLTVELIGLNAGIGFVEYEIKTENIGEEGCFVIITAPSGEQISEQITENGIHSLKADGLQPDTDYTLHVVSRDGLAEQTVHLEASFKTLKEEPGEEPPPDSYTGVYELPEIDLENINWNEKQLDVPVIFEKIGEKYYYNLIVCDADGSELQTIRGDGDMTAVIDIIDGIDGYKFTFEIYGVGQSEERLIESHDLGTFDVKRPKVTVGNVSLVGYNRVGIGLDIQNADGVSLRFDFSDGKYLDRPLTSAEIAAEYVELKLPETAISFTVTPTLTKGGYTLKQEPTEKVIENNLEIDTLVYIDGQYMSIELYIRGLTNGASYLHVISDAEDIDTQDYYVFDGYATVYFKTREQKTLRVYLTDDTGARLSNEVQITLDTSMPQSVPNYTLNYTNPGDARVTYNTDGTVNIYVTTGFACEDSSYYCRVNFGNNAVKTRDNSAVARNLPNTSYPLKYSVCFERDGIEYAVYTVVPSGAVNEVYYGLDAFVEENILTLIVENPEIVDMSNITAVTSDGRQIRINESDFTADDYGSLIATMGVDGQPEWVTVRFMISPDDIEIEGADGSVYIPYTIEIYP